MRKNKRFIQKDEVIANWVNRLLEKNAELSEENHALQDGLDFYKKQYAYLSEQINELEQYRNEMFIRERDTENELRDMKYENERLKEELESFEQINFTDMCNGSQTILYMKKENVGDSE